MEGKTIETSGSGQAAAMGSNPIDRPRARRWLRRSKSAEESARDLVRTHWDQCFRVAYLILRDHQRAEDVTQEGLLTLIRTLPDLEEDRSLEPWLHKVVVNRAIDAQRAERARPQPLDGEPPAPVALESDGSLRLEMIEALGEIEVEDRAAIVMRYVLDYRSAEIGEILGMPAATVRTRLHRGLEKLRARLEKSNAD